MDTEFHHTFSMGSDFVLDHVDLVKARRPSAGSLLVIRHRSLTAIPQRRGSFKKYVARDVLHVTSAQPISEGWHRVLAIRQLLAPQQAVSVACPRGPSGHERPA